VARPVAGFVHGSGSAVAPQFDASRLAAVAERLGRGSLATLLDFQRFRFRISAHHARVPRFRPLPAGVDGLAKGRESVKSVLVMKGETVVVAGRSDFGFLVPSKET